MNKINGRHITNLLYLPPGFFFLLQKLLKQKRFIKTQLTKELYPYTLRSDNSLGLPDFKKITSYYALGVPAVLGESFCVLRGKAMLPGERLCISYLGGISGLLDDLFDDPEKDAFHLAEFILYPEKLIPANRHEKLLLHFYELGLHYAETPDLIKRQAIKVFQSQVKSLEQEESYTEASEIKNLTYSKGGTSFVYYRLCLDHPLYETEESVIYELGGLMQLGNDIFDVWKDHQNGIKTIATLSTDIEEIRNTFIKKFRKCVGLAKDMSYPQKNLKRFLQISSLALARVYVCLDQFQELQQSTGNRFIIEKYSREQLICDMQKPKNQFKALKYYIKTEI